jgi:hypothetical protein
MCAFQELKEYRRHGIRTLADAEVFETERRRNKNAEQAAALAAKAVARSRLSAPPTPTGGPASTQSLEGVEDVTLLPTPSAPAPGTSKTGAAAGELPSCCEILLSCDKSAQMPMILSSFATSWKVVRIHILSTFCPLTLVRISCGPQCCSGTQHLALAPWPSPGHHLFAWGGAAQ